MSKTYKSTWHKMRELVILSLNIIFIKDLMQQCERLIAKTEYMNFPPGALQVQCDNYVKRKHELHKRVKELLEDILNSDKPKSDYCFNIAVDHASLTRKQLEKGYALFNNIRDVTFALNLRNGCLLPLEFPESHASDRNLMSLEYTAQHDGAVYKYFEINLTDPLKNELRY
jgi:hypothetical protein